MTTRRRPYRLHLPSRGRKVTFTTCERAVTAAADEPDGVYVIEWRDGRTWLPHTGLIVHRGRVAWRASWQHLRSVPKEIPA